jgi:hypothetical protein
MTSRGLVYLVHAPRRDGGWIHFRTCDEREARALAATLGVPVQVSED